MKVQVSVRVDDREVATVEHSVEGEALELEQQTEVLKDRVGQVVLTEGFEQLDSELRRPCCCGRPMQKKGTRPLTVNSQSGEITLERRRYRCRQCGCGQTPADAQICCGRHRITRHLGKQICQLATVEHFTRLELLMADQHGVHLGHDQMQQLVHDVGGRLDKQRQAAARRTREQPSKVRPRIRPRRIYVSCDGIMYCTNEREPCPSADNPDQKRLVWRQMRVGCVYWQNEAGQWQKQVMWGQEELPTFAASLYRLACEHGYREAAEKVFICDGADWCWTIHDRYFADAAGLLDWYHASQHVWACAKTLHRSEAAVRDWVDQALERLRTHGGDGLLDWLEPQRQGLRRPKRQALNSLLGYFHSRINLTDYPGSREKGWQIGSGMIESTAKQLVGLRLKGPGMHWTPAGAAAVTALRAHNLNNNWHSLWKNLVL